MKNIKLRITLSLILNILMIVLVAISVVGFFTNEGLESGAGNMTSGGAACFNYFTIDSNILAALCSLVIIPFNIKSLKSGTNEIPRFALLLKFVGTTAVTVTLMVVVFFLGPIMGYGTMFIGNCFFLHLLCPLIAIASLCFFEQGISISKKQTLLGVIPTLIYGTVYLINVIFTKVWDDFYHFNIGDRWYLSYIVMMLVTYLLALALSVIHNKFQKR